MKDTRILGCVEIQASKKCFKMGRKSVKIFLVSCLVINSYQFRAHRLIIESNTNEGADSADKTEFNPIFRPNVKVCILAYFV